MKPWANEPVYRDGTFRDGGSHDERSGQSSRRQAVLRWWLAPAAGLLWRVPLLVLLCAGTVMYGFRGLVHLAFCFDHYPFGTFLLAPALLPFAALPALCFYVCIRWLPHLWRQYATGGGRRALLAAGTPIGALLLAQLVDLVQVNLLLLTGVHLPRLPLDPY